MKPKLPAIVVRTFRFVGFDRDVVGRFRSTTPDGVPDGHFRVVLVRPKGAPDGGGFMLSRCPSKPAQASVSLAMYRSGDMGCEGARLLASTNASAGAFVKPAAIAVFREGKRLTRPGLGLPRSSAPVRFDLYVNGGPDCPLETGHPGAPDCRAAFAPGQRYILTVAGRDPPGFSRWISRPGDKVPQVTSPQVELRNLRFLGLDKDVVGVWPSDPPDGRPDAHWSLDLAMPAGPRVVRSVTLERVRAASDRFDRPGVWCAPGCADAPGYAQLYASLNGQHVLLVPPGRTTVELPYTTTGVQLDLYASDVEPSVFAAGERFRVIVSIEPEGGAPPGKGIEKLPKFNVSTPWLTLAGG